MNRHPYLGVSAGQNCTVDGIVLTSSNMTVEDFWRTDEQHRL